jgi:predicted O-methyltransferase YrrM
MSLRTFLKYTAAGRLVVMPWRFGCIALPFARRQFRQMLRWTFDSKEHYNFTYHLKELNRKYLASYISVVSGHPYAAIEKYFAELESNDALRTSLERRALASPDRHNSDIEPRYGRRLGWYALVRATKPRVILETGVDRGLGTAVFAAALIRNTEEGFPGLVYGTDIAPACGHLLEPPYKDFCRIILGDSIESLKRFDQSVDIFIHDSDHRPDYEWGEFVAIEPRLHAASIVMSDNSYHTSKLLEFARRRSMSFLYFQDDPKDHWWTFDGIGAAFHPGAPSYFPKLATPGPSPASPARHLA